MCNLFYDGHSHAHTTHMHEKRTLYGSEVGKKAFAQMSSLQLLAMKHTIPLSFVLRPACRHRYRPFDLCTHAKCCANMVSGNLWCCTVLCVQTTQKCSISSVCSHFLSAMSSRLHRTMNILNFALKRPPHRKCILSA